MEQSLHRFFTLSMLAFLWLSAGCSQDTSTGPDGTGSFPPADTITASLTIEGAGDARFTPDGKRLVVAHATIPFGRTVATLYDVATGQKIRSYEPYPGFIQEFFSMAISNDGKRLAVAGVFTGTTSNSGAYPGIMIWDVETGDDLYTSLDLRTSALPESLVFAPGDSFLVGGYRGRLVAYGTNPAYKPPYYLPEIDSSWFEGTTYMDVSRLEVSPGGRYILSNLPALWDLSTRRLVEDFGSPRQWGIESVAYRGDDRQLVGGNANGVVLLSMDQNKPLKYIRDDYYPDHYVSFDPAVVSVAASTDGKLVGAVDDWGRVKVWIAESGKPLVTGSRATAGGWIDFSSDSRLLMTIGKEDVQSGERVVQLWKMP